jgi:hypothetical protein
LGRIDHGQAKNESKTATDETRNAKVHRTQEGAKGLLMAKRKRAKRALGKTKRKEMKVAKRVQSTKLINAPAVETVVVDVIEEPLTGVITVTEFEERIFAM